MLRSTTGSTSRLLSTTSLPPAGSGPPRRQGMNTSGMGASASLPRLDSSTADDLRFCTVHEHVVERVAHRIAWLYTSLLVVLYLVLQASTRPNALYVRVFAVAENGDGIKLKRAPAVPSGRVGRVGARSVCFAPSARLRGAIGCCFPVHSRFWTSSIIYHALS